jgi:hypothetical protein
MSNLVYCIELLMNIQIKFNVKLKVKNYLTYIGE